MVWHVARTDPADADLEQGVRFVAKFSPGAAIRIGTKLVSAVFSLDHFPHRGAQVRERPGLRRMVHDRFLIFYRVGRHERKVEIIRIWDARRDPASLRVP
jgi:plasmid stabilization system protein ParE